MSALYVMADSLRDMIWWNVEVTAEGTELMRKSTSLDYSPWQRRVLQALLQASSAQGATAEISQPQLHRQMVLLGQLQSTTKGQACRVDDIRAIFTGLLDGAEGKA